MAHPYFTDDGFIQWFDDEMKLMIERDAAEFKMRQKKFRKSKGRAEARSNDSDSRPQSQPPAAVPPEGKAAQGKAAAPPPPQMPPPADTWDKPASRDYFPTGGDPPDEPPSRHDNAALPQSLLGGGRGDTYGSLGSQHASGDLGPPQLEDVRRPATRGSECGGGSGATEFGTEEMPMLPNLQRPTTPRAQRLVAFPQLASALEDQGQAMPAAHNSMSRNWGNSMPPPQHHPTLKGKRVSDENHVPSMPSLRDNPNAPSASHQSGGGSNLPQLKEGQLFAAELPDRYPGGGSLHAHAPVPASRGGGTKKKASAYDPSNPYMSAKAPGKGKSKSKASTSHALADRNQGMQHASSSQMGVVGQAHSIAGLSAAYALPPSALPPRTPQHDYNDPPPRTPVDGYGNPDPHGGGAWPSHNPSSSQFGTFGGPSGFGGTFQASGRAGGGLGSNAFNSTGFASGGQYAKYGKRY